MQPTPADLGVGDHVVVRGDRLPVVGALTFWEGGATWYAFALGSGGRWLGVEPLAHGLSLVLWNDVVMPVDKPKRVLEVMGEKVRRTEKGHASYTAQGLTRTGAGGRVRYHDYVTPDGRRFAMEQYDDGPWETSVGETLAAGDVLVLTREGV